MEKTIRLLGISLLLLLPALAKAQLHQPVLPGLEGSELLQALQNNFRPNAVLSYGEARDVLFGEIDARNDTLYGVYTNYAVYLPPGSDPTVAAFQGGSGINTEHSYPRSKGADGFVPEADMHHLFPTRVQVNADRASFPFAEVPDNEAVSWYYLDQQFSNKPASDTGQFSELGVMAFEPRNAYKGDIARAIFYFYTMYRAEAEAADPNFFEAQRATLCQWQAQDPVDQREWGRTQAIASYQEGKANPFVLDCTLLTRSYCAGDVAPCTPPVSSREAEVPLTKLHAYPQPSANAVSLEYRLPRSGTVRFQLFSPIGALLGEEQWGQQAAGAQQIQLRMPDAAGMYLGLLWLDGQLLGRVRLLRQ